MRNSMENARVNHDYLVRLAPFWCRGDTNVGRIDAFIAPRACSTAIEASFEGEEGGNLLARAHLDRLAAIDDHLAGARARVVVRRHHEAVGAGREDREE